MGTPHAYQTGKTAVAAAPNLDPGRERGRGVRGRGPGAEPQRAPGKGEARPRGSDGPGARPAPRGPGNPESGGGPPRGARSQGLEPAAPGAQWLRRDLNNKGPPFPPPPRAAAGVAEPGWVGGCVCVSGRGEMQDPRADGGWGGKGAGRGRGCRHSSGGRGSARAPPHLTSPDKGGIQSQLFASCG